jgi:NAD(P)-dependent dehydrogenase (short-subunit alcohol dehydrogenase family)
MSATGDVIARGNVAVITGGASGIGLAMAERFIAEGMSVLLADIDEPKLRNVEARLTEAGADVATRICNTASENEVAELAELALERFGAVHILCNNAGIAGMGDAWTESMELWDRVIGVNLYGVIHGVRSFLPIMQQQGVGHIVNTASMAGLVGMPGAAPYNVTKHGVVALSEGLFIELQLTGSPVGVSVLCPGFVKTDLMNNEPDRIESPIGKLMIEMLHTAVESGVPASGIADQVADAISAGRFWILTHPDLRQRPVERMQRAAEQSNPTLPAGD